MCTIEDFSSLSLLPEYRELLKKELKLWHSHYLPKNLTGKEVIDGGAGCGETAQFFLNHGARHVYCFESSPEALAMLHRNFDGDDRVTIISSYVGFIKLDLEGGEKEMVVETHESSKWKRTYGWNPTLWQLSYSNRFVAFVKHPAFPIWRRLLIVKHFFSRKFRSQLQHSTFTE
jgi:hypothetical protein